MSDSYLDGELLVLRCAPLNRNEMSLILFSLLFRLEANQQWKKNLHFLIAGISRISEDVGREKN